MKVLIFGSNVDQLRSIPELIAPDVALLRDPNVWAGEVEQCDAVMFLDEETRQDLLDAYKGVDILPSPEEKKPSRKKPKDTNEQAKNQDGQLGDGKGNE